MHPKGSVVVTLTNVRGPILLEIIVIGQIPGLTASVLHASPLSGQPTRYTVQADDRLPITGTFEVVLKASAGGTSWTETRRVTMSPPFFLRVSPSSLIIRAGRSATLGVTISRVAGYAGRIALAMPSLPVGVQVVYSAPSLPGEPDDIVVNAAASAPLGTYPSILRATSGPYGSQADFDIEVHSANVFDIVPAIGQLTAVPGSTHIIPITFIRNGYDGPLSLQFQTLATGVTGSFTPNPTSSLASTLEVTVLPSAPTVGPVTLSILGTIGNEHSGANVE